MSMRRNRGTRSTAVMQRRVEPPDSFDFFPTPPWATRALLEYALTDDCSFQVDGLWRRPGANVWDPACGEGHMTGVLEEYFDAVRGSDVFDYGQAHIEDFLYNETMTADWIITNPPFVVGADFARAALERSNHGCALLVRAGFLSGQKRCRDLFNEQPPTLIAFFPERVPMHRGRWVVDGSTATDYCWLIWKHGADRKPPMWIAPGCRKRLTRPDDAVRFNGVFERKRAADVVVDEAMI